MSTHEPAMVATRFSAYEEIAAGLDDRTLEIVERRRRMAIVRDRGWLVRRLLAAADAVGLASAFLLAEAYVARAQSGAVNVDAEIAVFAATLPLWIVVAKLYGLYDNDEERTDHSTADDFTAVFHMVTVCTWLFWASTWLTSIARPTVPKLVVFWAAAVAFVSIGRVAARTIARRNVAYLQNTVIVGAGDVGQMIAKKLLHHPEYGVNLVGFIDDWPKERREDLDHLALLGGVDRLPEIVELLDVERIIIAFSNEKHEDTLDLIRSLRQMDVQIDIVPRLFELVGPGVGIHTVEGVPLIGLVPTNLARSSRLLKRAMDLLLATVGLIALGPLFVAVAVAIKLDSSGPVFFRQVRMGCGDKTFFIYKFRSMCADADQRKLEFAHLNKHLQPGGDERMFKIEDDPRTTRVGRVLRRFSLDELPQLLNVVRGEMSLVGPRPLILDEHAFVTDWAERRLDLRPGITGVWQVLGRDGIGFDEMVRLDYLYVMDWSLSHDLYLLFRTLPRVLARHGRTA